MRVRGEAEGEGRGEREGKREGEGEGKGEGPVVEPRGRLRTGRRCTHGGRTVAASRGGARIDIQRYDSDEC